MHLDITLIGGPTALIELAGNRLLTDPTFDAPRAYHGAVTLTKQTGPALSADSLGPIDAVLLTHDQHADNLDEAGRALLPQAKRVLSTPLAAQRLGNDTVGLEPWQTVTLASGLMVTGTPCRHGPAGIDPVTGPVTGFLLGTEQPGDAVYISGDTVWYEGTMEIAKRTQPKLIILFTGAAEPRGPMRLTMDNNDALDAAAAFPSAKVIAIHNQGWEHFSESQEDVLTAFTIMGQAGRLVTLELGQATRVEL